MGKKTIVFFIASLNSGGAEHQIVVHANLLNREGYPVLIVTFGDSEDYYELDKEIKRIRLAPNKPKWIKFLTVFRFFLSVKTDCIVSYTQRASAVALFPLMFRKGITVIACERSFTYSKPSRQERLLVGFLYRRADYIVANSFSQRDYLRKQRPEWKDKILTIINYTDVDLYPFTPLPNHENRRIGVFARFSNAKNCIRVARAIKMLQDMKACSFVLEWYGNNDDINGAPNPYLEALRKEIQALGIGNCFHLNNHVKSVATQIKQMDAVLLPSIFEGFSNAISEAICCGRPVLASDVSDNSVMVKEGKNGFLFNPASIEDMASAFLRYLNTPDKDCEIMGLNSRRIAEQLFDKDAFLNDYIRLIEKRPENNG